MKMSKKWTRHWARRALAGVLAGSLCIGMPGLAKMEEKQEYNFDPVLVTAMRRESKDLTTPAAVEVLTSEKIKETGASNVLEALKFSTGLTTFTYGAGGTFYSGMTAGVSIRGLGKDLSALVLVNGVPLNLNGKYALESIPADSIERIEIIKGASSTLYGTAALGGVINIITKKSVKNSISTEVGSFGTNREVLTLQEGKFTFYASRAKVGDMGRTMVTKGTGANAYYYNFPGQLNQTYDLTWSINDAITWNYRFSQNDFEQYYIKQNTGLMSQGYNQMDTMNTSSIVIKAGSWLNKLYYNGLVRNLRGLGAKAADTSSRNYMQTYGIDSQSNWKTPYANYTAGLSWQKDSYQSDDFLTPQDSISRKERDLLSFFAQMDHALSKKTNIILGLRHDVVMQQNGLDNYYEWSPQLQLLHKINKEQSLYFNAGKSFRAANWTAMYSSTTLTIPNPSLEPDNGWTYEIGWKKIGESDSLKIALFKMDFPSFHAWKTVGSKFQSQNTEFRNLGLEMEYARSLKNGWGYKFGAVVGSPEDKLAGNDWNQSEAKLQLTAGINYKKKKWSGSLVATYVGNRQMDTYTIAGVKPKNEQIPSALQANMTLSYAASKDTEFSLRVENLFNRIDYTNTSGYITPERAFYLKLTQKF